MFAPKATLQRHRSGANANLVELGNSPYALVFQRKTLLRVATRAKGREGSEPAACFTDSLRVCLGWLRLCLCRQPMRGGSTAVRGAGAGEGESGCRVVEAL